MKVGIVGSGMISAHHLHAIARYPGCEIVGIVDQQLARARAQADRFSVTNAFQTRAELLALKPDVVHVLTPPGSHAAITIEALEAGAHVYVEKPMAISEDDCNAMLNASARSNRELCIGHCYNYIPVVARAYELIASGVTGDVVQVAASYNYDIGRNPTFGPEHWSRQLPGGLTEDLAVHMVSFLIRLLGAPTRASAVSRVSATASGPLVEEVRGVVETERGLGTLSVSLRGRPDMILLDIWCTRMLLRLNVSCMALTMYRQLPVPQKIGRGLANLDVASQLITSTVSATWKLLRGKLDGSYGIAPCIHAFYDALRAGKRSPIDPKEGAQTVAVLRSLWPLPSATDASALPRTN
jgi:2-alkyl-3-oxoalkanoate reductase